MSFLSSIFNTVGDNFKNQKSSSSEDYKNAFSAANESIGNTQNLANQYTGNQGFQNSLEQAGVGADRLANAAVGQSTSGARGAGMSKAQAAAMGNQMANQAYANAFQNQQANAMGMGQNAISAQQGITFAQQGQAGQVASEKQNVYNRATNNFDRVLSKVGGAVQTGAGL